MEWLVPPIDQVPTRNCFMPPHPRVRPVEFCVLHYTAGTFESALSWFQMQGGPSAHFLVSETGRVLQLVPLEGRAWHGDSPTGSDAWMGGKDTNARSIGIEIANFGRLVKQGSRWCRQGVRGDGTTIYQPVPADRVVLVKGQGWHSYPVAQVQATLGLCVRLAGRFPQLLDGVERFTGHENIDPTRKTDPGPLFPWDRLRSAMVQMRGGIMPDLRV